jgi:hypothetical protein
MPAVAPMTRRRRLALRFPHKQPVINVAQRVRHEGLAFIVAPLAINNEFVLVVAAGGGQQTGTFAKQARVVPRRHRRLRCSGTSRGRLAPHTAGHGTVGRLSHAASKFSRTAGAPQDRRRRSPRR